jgi:hypothetical protein
VPKDREPFVSQTEHPRVAIPGQRFGSSTEACNVVAIRDGDHVDLYPHGLGEMGVRISRESARELGAFLAA